MFLLLQSIRIIQATEMTSWADILQQKLHGWAVTCLKMLPNLVLAILLWLAFYALARLFRRFGHPVIRRLSRSRAVSELFFDLIYIAILVAGLYVGLNVLKLDKIAVSLLAGAGILGFTLAFAFQDLTSNFISGVYIDFNKPFDIGDVIETNGIIGEVEDIGLRSTTLTTLEGTHLMMPNKNIFQNTLINHSRTRLRAVKIDFEMTIRDSMEGIGKLLSDAVGQVKGVEVSRTPACFFTDIDADKLKVSVFFWIARPSQEVLMKMRHRVILAVLQVFRDHDIKRLA